MVHWAGGSQGDAPHPWAAVTSVSQRNIWHGCGNVAIRAFHGKVPLKEAEWVKKNIGEKNEKLQLALLKAFQL